MNGLGTSLLGSIKNSVDTQVALARGRRTDEDRFIGEPDMPRARIGFGVDGHRSNAHAAGGLDDPTGDLAAVRDQDFAEHGAPPPAWFSSGVPGRSTRPFASPGRR